MNHVAKKQQGFTIIELTLAMTFISFLLLGIALTIIQISAIYNSGVTTKEINQLSRGINDDLNRNIPSAGSLTLASDYVLIPNATNPVGGRLCLGSYSYIWNYAKTAPGTAGFTMYTAAPDGRKPADQIRLIRVPDPGALYCLKNAGALVHPNIRSVDTPLAIDLLKTGDHELGIHDFSVITPPASAIDSTTGQQLYSISYIIGTTKMVALNAPVPAQTTCIAAGLPNADPLYCNVQQFNLVLRVGNGVN